MVLLLEESGGVDVLEEPVVPSSGQSAPCPAPAPVWSLHSTFAPPVMPVSSELPVAYGSLLLDELLLSGDWDDVLPLDVVPDDVVSEDVPLVSARRMVPLSSSVSALLPPMFSQADSAMPAAATSAIQYRYFIFTPHFQRRY